MKTLKTVTTLMVASAIAMATMSAQADWSDTDPQNVQIVNDLFENGGTVETDIDRDMMWSSNYEFQYGYAENNNDDVDMIFGTTEQEIDDSRDMIFNDEIVPATYESEEAFYGQSI